VLEAGGTWRDLGSGVAGAPYAFAERGSSLFVGGHFSRAGGKAAFGFAEWNEAGEGGGPVLPTFVPNRVIVTPNPSAVAVHLSYQLPAAGDARVEIFDLNGRLVDTPFAGYQSAGPQDVLWQPDPARVKAGVYFAKLSAHGAEQIVRVVRVD
jgi:hypothetical protein